MIKFMLDHPHILALCIVTSLVGLGVSIGRGYITALIIYLGLILIGLWWLIVYIVKDLR